MSLYAVAFFLMVAAAAVLAVAARSFLNDRSALWFSIGLSAGAIVVAVASVLLPRRR
jgi:hypothetical protein